MKKIFVLLFLLLAVAIFALDVNPSLDGRAVVADEKTFPTGFYGGAVGYLPGDLVTVTNHETGSSCDIMILMSLEPSQGIAVSLSPDAAKKLKITSDSNSYVKIQKKVYIPYEETLLDDAKSNLTRINDPDKDKEELLSQTPELTELVESEKNKLRKENAEEVAEVPQEPEVTEEIAELPVEEPTEELAEVPLEPEVTEEIAELPVEKSIEEVAEIPQEPEVTEEIAELPLEPEVSEEIVELPVEEATEELAELPQEPEVTEEIVELPVEETTQELAELPQEPEVTEEIVELPVEEATEELAEIELDSVIEEPEIVVNITRSNDAVFSDILNDLDEDLEVAEPNILKPTDLNPPVAREESKLEEPKEVLVVIPEVAEKVETSPERNFLPDEKQYYLQIATMSKEKNAQAIVDKYGKNYPITINEVKKNRYQVVVGPISEDEREIVLARFKSYGFKDSFFK